MYLDIPVKPLSINQASQGRRFKTPKYKQYEKDVSLCVGMGQYDMLCKDDVYVVYIFHLSTYALSDCSNFEKCLTDILVKRQYLNDDRYIKSLLCVKERCPKGFEKIEVYIFTDKHEFMELIAAKVQVF